jgi:hypothetical protein
MWIERKRTGSEIEAAQAIANVQLQIVSCRNFSAVEKKGANNQGG